MSIISKYCVNPNCINGHQKYGLSGKFTGDERQNYCCHACYFSTVTRNFSSCGTYSPEEMNLIKNLRNNDETYQTIADVVTNKLGIKRTKTAIRRHVAKNYDFYGRKILKITRNIKPQYDEEIVSPFIRPVQSEDIQIPFVSTKAHILNNYIDMLKEIKKSIIPSNININKFITPDNESIVLMLSDLHIGKKVLSYKDEIIYNTEIAINYLDKITLNLMKVINHIQKGSVIDEIVILLIGDIIDNESIYETQSHHVDSHVAKQVKVATRCLWKLITEIANMKGIKLVRVHCVRGNHGRQVMGHEESNWDNVIYDNLEYINSIAKIKNIYIESHYAEFNIAEVRGHRLLMRHEAPLTADTPAAKAKLGGWVQIHSADAVCCGHWHHIGVNLYNDVPIFRNGSLPGSDDLSERIAAKNRPAQLLFGVTKKRLPTFIYSINFDDEV